MSEQFCMLQRGQILLLKLLWQSLGFKQISIYNKSVLCQNRDLTVLKTVCRRRGGRGKKQQCADLDMRNDWDIFFNPLLLISHLATEVVLTLFDLSFKTLDDGEKGKLRMEQNNGFLFLFHAKRIMGNPQFSNHLNSLTPPTSHGRIAFDAAVTLLKMVAEHHMKLPCNKAFSTHPQQRIFLHSADNTHRPSCETQTKYQPYNQYPNGSIAAFGAVKNFSPTDYYHSEIQTHDPMILEKPSPPQPPPPPPWYHKLWFQRLAHTKN